MSKTKFEVIVDIASKKAHSIWTFLHENHTYGRMLLFFICCWILIISTLAAIGFFSEGFLLNAQFYLDNFRNEAKYCESYISRNKATICSNYQSIVVETCKPHTNSTETENVKQ